MIDLRWKNPQGSTERPMFTWAQDLIRELRKGAYLNRGSPSTQTGNFTVADNQGWYIIDNAGGATTVTLPAPGAYEERWLLFKTTQAQTLVSASSNVVPLAGGAAGTAILPGVAGSWALMVSDGTNWVIMAAG